MAAPTQAGTPIPQRSRGSAPRQCAGSGARHRLLPCTCSEGRKHGLYRRRRRQKSRILLMRSLSLVQVHSRIKTPVWVKMVRMGNVASDVFATLQCAVEQYYVEYMCRSVCCRRGDDRKPFHACTLYVHGTPLQNRAWALLKPCNSRWAAVITCRGACRVGSRVLS